MREIKKIYKKCISPINLDNNIKLIEVFSKSDDINEFKERIINYTDKGFNKNTEYKEDLYNYLCYKDNFTIDDKPNNFVNIKNNDIEKDFSIILNTNYNSTMKLTELFLKECEKYNINFDISFNKLGETDNSFMINCTGDRIIIYLKILNELRKKYPDVFDDINEPGLLFSKIDDKISICSSNNGLDDFYNRRCEELYNSISYFYNKYLYEYFNKNLIIMLKPFTIVDLLSKNVSKEIKKELDNKDYFKDLDGFVREELIKRFKNNNYNDLELKYMTNCYDYGYIRIDKEKLKRIFNKSSYEIFNNDYYLQEKFNHDLNFELILLSNYDNSNFAFDKNCLAKKKNTKEKKMF